MPPTPSRCLGVGGLEILGHKRQPDLARFWARGPETVEEVPDGSPPGLSRMPLEGAESSPAVASPNWPGEAGRRSSLSLAPHLGNGFGVQGCESLARH